MTQVLPPAAAAAVAEGKSSAISTSGPEGCAMWTWLSIPPGMTTRPEASMVRAASASASPTATIRPSRMATSARNASDAVTTVPPRTERS